MSRTIEKRSISDARYHGFDLQKICWGYREVFRNAIDSLFAQGLIGDHRPETTAQFFAALNRSDLTCYDHVLREFLGSIHPSTYWVFGSPSLISDLTETGHRFSREKTSFGLGFYRTFGKGALGNSPKELRSSLTTTLRLLEYDPALAFSFVEGFQVLTQRLAPDEIDCFVNEGLSIHARHHKAGYAFLACRSKAAESAIREITRECRLTDVKDSFATLLRALTGSSVRLENLGGLNTDQLLSRNATVVYLRGVLYLPQRIRYFDSPRKNADWYKLCAIGAASLLISNSFAVVHGQSGYESCRELVGSDWRMCNMFFVMELVRGIRTAVARWPGSVSLLRFGLKVHFGEHPPATPPEFLLKQSLEHLVMGTPCPSNLPECLRSVQSPHDAVEMLHDNRIQSIWLSWDKERTGPMAPVSFLPDFLYQAKSTDPPRRPQALDSSSEKNDRPSRTSEIPGGQVAQAVHSESRDEERACGSHWYDEWDSTESVYREKWCAVDEVRTSPGVHPGIPLEVHYEIAAVRRVFERMKPDAPQTERRLSNGDYVDIDRLVAYRVQRRLEPDPRVDFYEKPLVSRRDLAVLLLLDVSGSTSIPRNGSRKIIDLVKHAALVLGSGLHAIGDRFAIAGFSSDGREYCSFYRYKSFDDPWNEHRRACLMSAIPRNSTRIGPALRHAGTLLGKETAAQRLIMLITDGKPMDAGYCPVTRYAHHDIRMACEENLRKGISTFGISTEENTLGDMELMFPGGRFTLLSDISLLPAVLPKLYLRLTL